MLEELIKLLEGKINKDRIKTLINKEDKIFKFFVQHCCKNEFTSWRAAWVLHHAIQKNDNRIKPHLKKIILSIKEKKDGHQRELLKIVQKMELTEKEEGYFFDSCVNLWEEVHKKPATRYYAGLFIIKMAKKYPEIKNELEALTSEYYTKTLSSGIRRIFDRELLKIN